MLNTVSNSAAKIGYDGKYFFLLQDNGEPFRAQISMTIHDSVNQVAKATVVTHINIEEIKRIDNNLSMYQHETRGTSHL